MHFTQRYTCSLLISNARARLAFHVLQQHVLALQAHVAIKCGMIAAQGAHALKLAVLSYLKLSITCTYMYTSTCDTLSYLKLSITCTYMYKNTCNTQF